MPNKGKSNTKLFVCNLAPDVTTEKIKVVFSLHGRVSAVYLAMNRLTARSRGIAVVTMHTEEGAQTAIKALHGSMSDGRSLNVSEADERHEAGSFVRNYTPRREFRKLY
jgi:RNA recognition motif-containing protein